MSTVPITELSLDPYRVATTEEWRTQYRFPFVALDAPGWRSLGRITWFLELLRSPDLVDDRRLIASVLLWAQQTHDPRYKGLFRIPCLAERFQGILPHTEGNVLQNLWCTVWCEEHDGMIFVAYPKDDHTALVVDTSSSVSLSAYFTRDTDDSPHKEPI